MAVCLYSIRAKDRNWTGIRARCGGLGGWRDVGDRAPVPADRPVGARTALQADRGNPDRVRSTGPRYNPVMSEPLVRSIETVTHGRVLLRLPLTPPPWPMLVGFHGYGENAEKHLEQLRSIPGVDGWMLVAVQGLHRFYTGRMEEVVASWMTRQDREQAIADNIAYVDRVVEAVGREHQTVEPLVYVGFSQGVAMAFRAAVRGAARAAGVIALGGDVPPDVHGQRASQFGRVLLGRGVRDSWYTDEKVRSDVERLQANGVEVEAVVFDGGHEWTDEFRQAASQFLQSPKL